MRFGTSSACSTARSWTRAWRPFIHADTGYWNEWWRLAIAGVGFALGMSPLTGASIQAVSPQEGGLASGISSTARQVGAVLGVAVLGAVVTARQGHARAGSRRRGGEQARPGNLGRVFGCGGRRGQEPA